MAPRGSLLLLALLLLSCALPRARGQHWSHGWYPGGKRDLRTPSDLQVPSPLGRCRPLPCPPRREEPLPDIPIPWLSLSHGCPCPRAVPVPCSISLSPPVSLSHGCPRPCPAPLPNSISHHAPLPHSGCAAHRYDVTLRAARSLRRRHAAGAEALPPGARPAPGAWPRLRPLPGALPRLGPAGSAGAGPQDPARSPRQVQGGPGEAAAARGPRGAAGGAGAVPAAPAGAQRPPGGVQGRGAAEEAGGAPDWRGLAGGAGGAPAADGLERGGERPAEGPQRGETQERRRGAEEEEVRDCREAGQENGSFPGGEGEGGSPAAGGSQKLHHPREPGGSDRGVPGQPPELQLRHRQGRARRQAHGALVAALALVCRAPRAHRSFLGMYKLASEVVEKGSGCAASKGLMGKGVRGTWRLQLSPVAVPVIPPPTCLDPSHTACGGSRSSPEAEPGSAPRCQLWMLPKAKEG